MASSCGRRAHSSFAALPPRWKATSPPSAQQKKPHLRAWQCQYSRPLFGVSLVTVAAAAGTSHRQVGGTPGTSGAGARGGGAASSSF